MDNIKHDLKKIKDRCETIAGKSIKTGTKKMTKEKESNIEDDYKRMYQARQKLDQTAIDAKGYKNKKRYPKKYNSERNNFLMIPNLLKDKYKLGAVEIGVYLHIKYRAGEKGKYFERSINASRACKISHVTFRKYRDKLKDLKLINFIGQKREPGKSKGGKQILKFYKIVDIWKENVDYYAKKDKGPIE